MNEYTKNFKRGDKVTIVGLGFGYVNDVTRDGYTVYIINNKISGDGYKDYDLRLGWNKRVS